MDTKTYPSAKLYTFALGDKRKSYEKRKLQLERLAEKLGTDPSKCLRFLIDSGDRIVDEMEKIK